MNMIYENRQRRASNDPFLHAFLWLLCFLSLREKWYSEFFWSVFKVNFAVQISVRIARLLKQVLLFSWTLFSTQALTIDRHICPVPLLYYIGPKLLIIWVLLKILPLPRSVRTIPSIPRKLALPTGTLKQNIWGNEFSISRTDGTHVSVSGTCSRFWKRKAL